MIQYLVTVVKLSHLLL